MRKPRPQDFDPNYSETKSPTSDEIDVEGITPIKPRFSVQKSIKPGRTKKRSEFRSYERPEHRTEKRLVDLPVKRQTKRYSFEFYEDQIHQIKKIKINTELQGKSIAMSEIVRKAVDDYLQNHYPENEAD